jgi:hypothetical protein
VIYKNHHNDNIKGKFMQTPRHALILTFVLLLVLSVSCSIQAPRSSSTDSPKDSLTTPLTIIQPTQPLTTVSTPKASRNTGAPADNQSGDALQNLSFEVPSHSIDMILGRPTGNSITVSVLAYEDIEGYIEYGPSPEHFSNQTPLSEIKFDQPEEILIGGLQPNTVYNYRVQYRLGRAGDYTTTEAGTFSTQRALGSPFTFTIQADSHLDSNSNPQVYLQTLANERAERPDFVIDLGDTFMTDKYKPYTDAQPQYLAQRYCLSQLGQTAPLFLVLGNHDGEGAPKGSSNDMSSWSALLRTKYFPNPIADGFYTGNLSTDRKAGALQDYYAWEWGSALFIVLDPYWFTPASIDSSDLWNSTLGEEQYQWLKTTLEASSAQWKFVFIHQLIGGVDQNGRGGVEVANLYEWGGQNADGSWGFDQQRPGWELPIHQLLVKNKVTAVFHGHDHLFIRQELDGIIYQEVPQPGASNANVTKSAVEYGYLSGDVLGSSGHLRVKITPDQVTVEYVRSYLPQDEINGKYNGQIDYKYSIAP